MDILSFLSKIEKKRWTTAYTDLRNAMAFPEIISELCGERCIRRCPRQSVDEPIKLRELERFVVKKAGHRTPVKYNLPGKKESVAVIGAGISGMACALRLCEKKYCVTVFEKKDSIGGSLSSMLSPEYVRDNIMKQFANEEVSILCGREIKDLEELSGFDGIYIATGKEGDTFSHQMRPGVYAGGALMGKDIPESCKDGIEAAKAIEAYFKTGKDSYTWEEVETCMPVPDLSDTKAIYPPVLKEDGYFDQEGALAEAGRCLRCVCDRCRKSCDLLSYYGKPVQKVMEEIRATTEVKGVLGENMTIATKMIAMCDQCGRCTEACPEDIDIRRIFADAKRALLDRGDVPWAFYYNFIRDMERADGRYSVTVMPDKGAEPEKLFFPGCQLGAMDSDHVIKVYEYLNEREGNVALAVSCCGMPSYITGDIKKADEELEKFRNMWVSMGRPEVIFACPSCYRRISSGIEDIRASYLYEYTDPGPCDGRTEVSVFDPCGSHGQTELHDLVRKKLRDAGYTLKPLKYERDDGKCCGFTGNMHEINREFEKYVLDERRRENGSEGLVVTYCANCKNNLNRSGVRTAHYLDLFLGMKEGFADVRTINDRDEGRKRIMSHYSGTDEKKSDIEIIADEAVLKKMDDHRMLMEDVEEVIGFCEKSGKKAVNGETGTFTGHMQVGYMTYWVEYMPAEDGRYKVVNVYGHRMRIVE